MRNLKCVSKYEKMAKIPFLKFYSKEVGELMNKYIFVTLL